MRAPRRILKTKTFHPITQLSQSRRGRTTGQAAADDDDIKLSAVVRIHQPHVVSVAAPFLRETPRRNFCVQRPDHNCFGSRSSRKTKASALKATRGHARTPKASRNKADIVNFARSALGVRGVFASAFILVVFTLCRGIRCSAFGLRASFII